MKRRLIEGGDLEQAVTILGPVDGGEQGILLGAVVARGDGAVLVVAAKVPARNHGDGPLIEARAVAAEIEQAGARDAGAVDDDADDVALGRGEAAVDGVCRRGWRRVDADQAEIAVKRLEHRRIERRGRAIIDHDHLVLAGVDAALVSGRERIERAGCFARDVVDHDHDRKPRPSPWVPISAWRGHIACHRTPLWLPPPDTGPIDRGDRRRDPSLGAIVLDRLTAGRHATIVVHDHETARRKLRIKVLQGDECGLIEIAVEADQGEGAHVEDGERVLEQALDENHLVIEQAVAREIRPHLISADRELLVLGIIVALVLFEFGVGGR
jgi:hypothetical protein